MAEQNQRPYPPRRRRRRRRLNPTFIIFWLVVLLAAVSLVAVILHFAKSNPGDETTAPTTVTTAPTESTSGTSEPTEETTGPTEPPEVARVSTATVAATGDMLMHMPCIRPAETSSGDYSFEHYFTYLQDYIQSADYAVANLETTLAGLDSGYEYKGYPDFNCPDGIVTSLQNVGFDMLLTANNHCYDTHSVGFRRTQQVISNAGMDYTGTFSDADTPKYLLKDLNGIKVGMICYTYEDSSDPNVVAPNGRTMTDNDEVLINAFNVNELDTFYANMADAIAAMEAQGAEATVLYIHWGTEYELKENSTQAKIAQKMCDLGVDVIVGGHPHVVQPMDLLTGTEDPNQKTLCIYSTGNALSNQRRDLMRLDTGHTEDGVLFSFTFAKYSDGTVRVEGAELLPLWVNKTTSSATGKTVYDILPLDKQIEDWKTQLDLTESELTHAEQSYERTMDIVGEGLAEIQEYLDSLSTP